MSESRPIIAAPEGWTYAEKSEFDFGRWVTTYTLTHDACGEVKKEHDRPVGDGGDGWWYREQAAKGLAFFLGIHPQNCTASGSA